MVRLSATVLAFALASVAVHASPSQQIFSSNLLAVDPVHDALPGVSSDALIPTIELPIDASSVRASDALSPESHIRKANGGHVRFTHAEFPDVSLRVKRIAEKRDVHQLKDDDKNAFCDPSVTSWSGYIDLKDGKSLFFYFFESRSDPEKDPVLLWTNGGPGCSSAIGLYQELGPCMVPLADGKPAAGPPINGTRVNPYSWNSRANLIVIDQPASVGYSYSRYGVEVGDSFAAATDIYKFLRVFFSAFDRFHDNEFVLTAESYGGTYLPNFGAKIVDENHKRERKAQKAGKKVDKSELINLTKISIGNGLSDVSKQIPAYYDFTCTRRGGEAPFLPIETCRRMFEFKKKCSEWLKSCRGEGPTSLDCSAAVNTCNQELGYPYALTGQNPYNIRDPCKSGLEPNLCYPQSADIRAYLDRPDVRELVGAASLDDIGPYKTCSGSVANAFAKTSDELFDSTEAIAALLERNIEILIYVGTLDWICNFLGNWDWVKELDWSGSEAFRSAKQYSWRVDGKSVGQAQSGGGLTWATVEDAGHMVPYDQPKAALELITRFLDGDKL